MARTARTHATSSDSQPVLYVALELSKKTWKLGFTTSRTQRARIFDVPARDQEQFQEVVAEAKRRLGLPAEVAIRSCYEAGRDGFWIHRFLERSGIQNVIFEAASIEVSRRKRKVKTDGVDVKKLVSLLVRHHEGEDVVRVVRVPPAEAEDERLTPRLLLKLKRERTALTNGIRAALFLHGLDMNPRKKTFRDQVVSCAKWDGQPLPPGTLREVLFDLDRLELVQSQIAALEKEQQELIASAAADPSEASPAQRVAAALCQLRGVGETSAYLLGTEFFGWRDFRNRKEVGALAGLTGTPFSSGQSDRDQGISKAGNPRVRVLMVQLAWGWLRWQPDSGLSRWFHTHVGQGGSRSRRKAIVALARKLLVELWHLAEHGVVPDGAVLSPGAAQLRAA